MYNPFLSLEKVPFLKFSVKILLIEKFLTKKFMAPYSGNSDNNNISPEISWQAAPSETKSFVVSIFDLDEPNDFGFWHWVVANIPGSITTLPQDAGNPNNLKLPKGAVQLPNDSQNKSYLGVISSTNQKSHRYFLAIWILDIVKIPFSKNPTLASLNYHMFGHVLARGTLYFKVGSCILQES